MKGQMVSKEMKALDFARWAHMGKYRRYTGNPFFHHCLEVAAFVRAVTSDSNMICAAYLHDMIEDTDVGRERIESLFGQDVADLVVGMTNPSRPEDGNRARRKAIDLEHAARQSGRVQMIRLADILSNGPSIVANDPAFARVYMREAEALMRHLQQGNRALRQMVEQLIFNWKFT